jgi:hypothetical protein
LRSKYSTSEGGNTDTEFQTGKRRCEQSTRIVRPAEDPGQQRSGRRAQASRLSPFTAVQRRIACH